MSKDEIFVTLKEMIKEQFGRSEEEIDKQASIIDDLAADSLDIVELVMNVEEKFKIEISDEDSEKILTVEDLVNYVYNNQ
ncbi:MAG: acyl carrier protein [Clostridia bacterium]|nr:acyl carrier protein [Clostridia bacterium]